MEKMPQSPKEVLPAGKKVSDLGRRNFLKLSGASVLVGALPKEAKANVERSPIPAPRPNHQTEVETQTVGETVSSPEAITETLKELVYEAYQPTNERALDFTEVLGNDLEVVTNRLINSAENANSSIMHLIDEYLSLASLPETVRVAVKEMMLYVPYVESRFSNDAVSNVEAFGIMQIMPSVWNELAQTGEERESVVDQIKVAGRLLEQTYRHLMNTHRQTMELITELLFAGDAEKCAREFLAPTIINGYFSGMGTIERVLDGFYDDYLNEQEKIKMAESGVLEDELGVYGLFATAGEFHSYSRLYGEESAKYVPKIIAAKLVMRNGLPPGMLAELVPGFTNDATT